MKNNTILMVVIAFAIAGGSFFGGMKYQQTKPRTAGNFQARNGGAGFGGGPGGAQGGARNGFRPVNGEILSSDDKSITVKMADGSSKIVLLTDTTTFNKAADASKSDLKTGEKVAVFGTTNADGSVTAQNVQLNPMLRGISGSPTSAPKQ